MDLPDAWLEIRKARSAAEAAVCRASADPAVAAAGWPRQPFALRASAASAATSLPPRRPSLRCRAAYDLRETSDFRKLVTLSQTGRSTATTLVCTAAVAAMRADPAVDANAQKLLSFTDNRQDASLQAGHLNDFVQVILLRGAVARALQVEGELTFDRIGPAVLAALDLEPSHYMKEAVFSGPG